MEEADEIKYMKRCLELAVKAEGLTYPNPMVGALILHNGKIVGEGYHRKAGEGHAEVIAINAVEDKAILKDSTLYVSLEPCSHFGKTPPCADFIVALGIPRVVVGAVDSSDKVSGRGLARLRDAGCEVLSGVLSGECRRVNRRFFTFNEKKRPYITLKWAQTADGYLDIQRSENHRTEPTWITGKPERALVHKWRSEEEAILIGAGTLRADDPKLNVRDWKGNDPLKLILSSSGNIDKGSSVFKTGAGTVIFTDNRDTGVTGSEIVRLDDVTPACMQIADYLYKRGIQSLFIEGGTRVLDHFISHGLWDEARIFSGEEFYERGVPAPKSDGKLVSKSLFSSSLLEIYLNPQSGFLNPENS
jgi:diaminohydroxyphosphoribosylaminopyrimidine deaminase / 5-amino-6-(5-phosphoribosylamino)uracil reductase